MCRGCILRGSNAAQSNPNMPTSVFLPVYTYSHLLWHHCSCLSPSYLIRHPLTPICNSNENKTPALPTFTPLCKSLHHNNKEKTEKGEVKKVWDRGSPYQKKILCYCWPARLDCQMAKHGKKKKGLFHWWLLRQQSSHTVKELGYDVSCQPVGGPQGWALSAHGRSDSGVIQGFCVFLATFKKKQKNFFS